MREEEALRDPRVPLGSIDLGRVPVSGSRVGRAVCTAGFEQGFSSAGGAVSQRVKAQLLVGKRHCRISSFSLSLPRRRRLSVK